MRRKINVLLLLLVAARPVRAQVPDTSAVIQTVELNASRPYFIPTHSRVTTTIRFPQPIGAPDGSVAVFAEDAAKASSAEYLVTWQSGDAYFTLTPLREARMANLNVPYAGRTYVFYFYAVADPLKAVASVNLIDATARSDEPKLPVRSDQSPPSPVPSVTVTRTPTAPTSELAVTTPARLLGFLDRLKLLHATAAGPSLAQLAKAMNVQIAVSGEELAAARQDLQGRPILEGVDGALTRGCNDAGLYQIILLRAVRDRRINCIGFICLVRNTGDQVLAFDVNSFGARAGAEYLMQRISDAPPILKPGEQSPAYFVIQPPASSPLSVVNDWKISVDLVSPRLNPGAAIARAFATTGARP